MQFIYFLRRKTKKLRREMGSKLKYCILLEQVLNESRALTPKRTWS